MICGTLLSEHRGWSAGDGLRAEVPERPGPQVRLDGGCCPRKDRQRCLREPWWMDCDEARRRGQTQSDQPGPESGMTSLVQNPGFDTSAQHTDTPVWSSHRKSSPTEQVAVLRQRNDCHAEVDEQDTGKKQITKLTADSESSQPTNASPEPGGGIEDICPGKKDPREMSPVEIWAPCLISEALWPGSR